MEMDIKKKELDLMELNREVGRVER